MSAEESVWKAECQARSFTRVYVDNETYSSSEMKEEESKTSTDARLMPLRPRDKIPFGANIKKAAFRAADIDEKTREVLERYQRKRSESICMEDLDDLMSDELSSNNSVSSGSSDSDLDLELDMEQITASKAPKKQKKNCHETDSIEKVATGIDL